MPLTRRNLLRILMATPVGVAGACCTSKYPKPIGEVRLQSDLMPSILAPDARARAAVSGLGPGDRRPRAFLQRVRRARAWVSGGVPGTPGADVGAAAPEGARAHRGQARRLRADGGRGAGKALDARPSERDRRGRGPHTARHRTPGNGAPGRRRDSGLGFPAPLSAHEAAAPGAGERRAAADRTALARRNPRSRHRIRTAVAAGRAGSGRRRAEQRRRDCRRHARLSQLHAVAAMGEPPVVHEGLHDPRDMRSASTRCSARSWTSTTGSTARRAPRTTIRYACTNGSTSCTVVRRQVDGKPYFYPVVAYNPWTDINQGGAALTRVVDACSKGNFVAVKDLPADRLPSGGQRDDPGRDEEIASRSEEAGRDARRVLRQVRGAADPGARTRGAVEWTGQRARRFRRAERMGGAAHAVCVGVPHADRRLRSFRRRPGRHMDPGFRRSHQPPPAHVALCRPRILGRADVSGPAEQRVQRGARVARKAMKVADSRHQRDGARSHDVRDRLVDALRR